tara:strand:- start:8920 stop:9189 length:270 start_codon:yes stop_codon:yes gene_type:complete
MEKQQTEKRAFLDVLINNAVETAIVNRDLASNSDVYQIVDEIAERVRYPFSGGRYGVKNNIEKKTHTRRGYVKINRASASPFTLSKGGF